MSSLVVFSCNGQLVVGISSFATPHRYCEGKRRAHSLLALHPDSTPMQLDKFPTQSQAQPRALDLLRCRAHLTKLLEYLLLILASNADPRVTDRDLHESILCHCADIDATTFRCELDRVR